MIKLLLVLLALGPITVMAGDGAFVYKGKRLKDNTKRALLFFKEFKAAELNGRKVDICFKGDWTIAQDSFSDLLSFSIETIVENKKLDVEVYNAVDDKIARGIILACP